MKNRKNINDPEIMGKESIGRLLFRFSMPAIIAMMVQAVYNVVDRAFIGHHVGLNAYNGIYVAFPIMMGLMAIAILFGVGGSSLFSIRLGEGDRVGAMKLLGNTTMMLILSSILVTILGLFFAEPLLRLFGASGDTMPYALRYIRIIFSGNIFMMLGMGLNNFLRAEGKATIAMTTMLIGAISNMVFDYLLIVVLGWGTAGAAWGTVFARILVCSWLFFYYFSGRVAIPFKASMMKLESKIISSVMGLGISAFFQQISMVIMTAVLNNVLLRLGGDVAISVMATVFSVMVMIYLPTMGIAQGAQPIFGFNFGAKKFARLKKSLIISSVVAFSFGIVGFLVVKLFSVQLTQVFVSSSLPNGAEVISITAKVMPIFLMVLPLTSLQIIGSGYFRSIGKVWHAMGLGLLRQFIFFIPILFILASRFGLDGVWYTGPLADILAFVVTRYL
ncbi:MAG: MATE family efflux transporter [Caldisericia bacterium]